MLSWAYPLDMLEQIKFLVHELLDSLLRLCDLCERESMIIVLEQIFMDKPAGMIQGSFFELFCINTCSLGNYLIQLREL
jgi:hypothetical protein